MDSWGRSVLNRETQSRTAASNWSRSRQGPCGQISSDLNRPIWDSASVLSAVASTAGTVTTAAGAADAYSRGFIGAAVMAAVVAVFALVRMPATRATDGGGHLHMH